MKKIVILDWNIGFLNTIFFSHEFRMNYFMDIEILYEKFFFFFFFLKKKKIIHKNILNLFNKALEVYSLPSLKKKKKLFIIK